MRKPGPVLRARDAHANDPARDAARRVGSFASGGAMGSPRPKRARSSGYFVKWNSAWWAVPSLRRSVSRRQEDAHALSVTQTYV